MEFTKREKGLIRFFKLFKNMNDAGRRNVACFVDEKPYSWNVVYMELVNNTELSMLMIEEIIKNDFKVCD